MSAYEPQPAEKQQIWARLSPEILDRPVSAARRRHGAIKDVKARPVPWLVGRFRRSIQARAAGLPDYLDFHKARELDRNHLSRYEHGEVPSLQLPGKRKSLLRIVQ